MQQLLICSLTGFVKVAPKRAPHASARRAIQSPSLGQPLRPLIIYLAMYPGRGQVEIMIAQDTR